jgi:hypothetical protein
MFSLRFARSGVKSLVSLHIVHSAWVARHFRIHKVQDSVLEHRGPICLQDCFLVLSEVTVYISTSTIQALGFVY